MTVPTRNGFIPNFLLCFILTCSGVLVSLFISNSVACYFGKDKKGESTTQNSPALDHSLTLWSAYHPVLGWTGQKKKSGKARNFQIHANEYGFRGPAFPQKTLTNKAI